MVAPPGSSSRGRGGKFKKYTRGGGKHFSRDIRPLDADGNEVSIWAADGKTKDDEDSDEDTDSEEEDSEEDSDDEPATAAQIQAASREDRKAEKKARKEAAIAKSRGKTVEVGDMPSSDEDSDDSEDDDMPANPNHSKASRNQAKGTPIEEITEGVAKIGAPTNRREREALEAANAKEKYQRLQAQGKTDEAKADLARLSLIREQRAAEAARRQAEKEEKEEIEKKKKSEIEAREARKREAAAGPKKGKKK
ncbi:casein kinase substrate phosphoprotein PP28 [Dactylonectria estremocensis]|uniref:Casein kinase substrate phosphoprotein PP28 n=1 Tax=Dactylonectria estremocensis TaxID=1079267 RepID=A0A9P9F3H2_9HYPO|nr:casein kinase substrate phosphoprotein PP28 [Dactylonectria estremocensis]